MPSTIVDVLRLMMNTNDYNNDYNRRLGGIGLDMSPDMKISVNVENAESSGGYLAQIKLVNGDQTVGSIELCAIKGEGECSHPATTSVPLSNQEPNIQAYTYYSDTDYACSESYEGAEYPLVSFCLHAQTLGLKCPEEEDISVLLIELQSTSGRVPFGSLSIDGVGAKWKNDTEIYNHTKDTSIRLSNEAMFKLQYCQASPWNDRCIESPEPRNKLGYAVLQGCKDNTTPTTPAGDLGLTDTFDPAADSDTFNLCEEFVIPLVQSMPSDSIFRTDYAPLNKCENLPGVSRAKAHLVSYKRHTHFSARLLQGASEDCVDQIDMSLSYDCAWYIHSPHHCGTLDTEDFTANDTCCACMNNGANGSEFNLTSPIDRAAFNDQGLTSDWLSESSDAMRCDDLECTFTPPSTGLTAGFYKYALEFMSDAQGERSGMEHFVGHHMPDSTMMSYIIIEIEGDGLGADGLANGSDDDKDDDPDDDIHEYTYCSTDQTLIDLCALAIEAGIDCPPDGDRILFTYSFTDSSSQVGAAPFFVIINGEHDKAKLHRRGAEGSEGLIEQFHPSDTFEALPELIGEWQVTISRYDGEGGPDGHPAMLASHEGVDPNSSLNVQWADGCQDLRQACQSATPVFSNISQNDELEATLGSAEVTHSFEVELETDWGEKCAFEFYLVNTDDADYIPHGIKVQGIHSETDEMCDDNDSMCQFEVHIDPADDDALGEWSFIIEINVYDVRHQSETFTVEITCDSTHDNFPYTPMWNRCPNNEYEWCANNYMEDAEYEHCPDFDNCLEQGDGDGMMDTYGNICKGEDQSCEEGWPKDFQDNECTDTQFCSNNWKMNANQADCDAYDPCRAGGEGGYTFDGSDQLCLTQYYAVCAGQEIKIPLGAIANSLFSRSGQLGENEAKFHQVESNVLDDNDFEYKVALFDYEFFAVYPDIDTKLTENELFKYEDANNKGYFASVPYDTNIPPTDFIFSYCEMDAWTTDNNDLCSDSITVTITFTEVCEPDDYMMKVVEWLGETQYTFNHTSDSYQFEIQHLLSNLDGNSVTPEQMTFFTAQTPSIGFSKGASSVKFEYVRYTSENGHVLEKSSTFSAYTSRGFDSTAQNLINEGQFMFSYDEATSEIVIAPTYDSIDGSPRRVPQGYYEAKLTLSSQACQNREYCRYDLDIMRQSLYFHICDGCHDYDWSLMIEDSLPAYNHTNNNDTIEPEPVDDKNDDKFEEDDNDALFWEARELFTIEYPMFQFIQGGEEKEIELHFIQDSYFDSLRLEVEYGSRRVKGFCEFENGVLTLEPEEDEQPGEYSITMTLSDSYGNMESQKMRLNLQDPQRYDEEEDDKYDDDFLEYNDERDEYNDMYEDPMMRDEDPMMRNETNKIDDPMMENDSESIDESIDDMFPLDMGPVMKPTIFNWPDPLELTCFLHERTVLRYKMFLNPDVNVKLDKVELLGLSDFATFDGNRLTISPGKPSQAGKFPFVLRVYDEQNLPYSQTFNIHIVDPDAPIKDDPMMDDPMMDDKQETDMHSEDGKMDTHSESMLMDDDWKEDGQTDKRESNGPREPDEPREPECDEMCREQKRQERMQEAGKELEEAIRDVVSVVEVEIEMSREMLAKIPEETIQEFEEIVQNIQLDLVDLTNDSEEERAQATVAVMASVATMPVQFQELVFVDIMVEKKNFNDQQRRIERLEAESQGVEYVEPAPPAMASQAVSPSGRQGMYTDEGCSGLDMLRALGDKRLSSAGQVEDESPGRRRRLSEDASSFSMDSFMTFKIVRGGEDSAPVEDLGFEVMSDGIDAGMLMFKLKFDHPLKISIGSEKDKMVSTIVDGSFFSSEENGMSIQPGTEIVNALPRMLPGEEFVMVMEQTQETMEQTTNTIVIAQIILTLLLSVSLKSMWNLFNVIQILAYLRFFTGWPAFMMEMLMYMDNTITMKPVSDPILEYGKSEFAKANETLQDENMKAMGVQDSGLFKSLGVFAVVLLGMLIAVLVFFVLKCCKMQKCNGIRTQLVKKLEKKLFYAGFIRYMIVSNLKLTYTVTAFLLTGFGYATVIQGVKSTIFLLVFIGIVTWPIFIMIFVIRNKGNLEEEAISKKWDALYQGIHTHKLSALFYNVIFCARRLDVVLINLFFSPGFPLTNFAQHQYVLKLMSFIVVQTFYIIYVGQTKPHTQQIFNTLEFFNESMIILMCYIMLVFTGIGERDNIVERQEPLYLSIGIAGMLVIVNLAVMLRLTSARMSQKLKEIKKQKLMNLDNYDIDDDISDSELNRMGLKKSQVKKKLFSKEQLAVIDENKIVEDDVEVESIDGDYEIRRDLNCINDLIQFEKARNPATPDMGFVQKKKKPSSTALFQWGTPSTPDTASESKEPHPHKQEVAGFLTLNENTKRSRRRRK